jgi:hypothetical protein
MKFTHKCDWCGTFFSHDPIKVYPHFYACQPKCSREIEQRNIPDSRRKDHRARSEMGLRDLLRVRAG